MWLDPGIDVARPGIGVVRPGDPCGSAWGPTRFGADRLVRAGVKDAAFAKKGTIEVFEAVRNPKQHKKLQRFRAGVEGIISFTTRCFSFGRCLWCGYRSFQAYAWVSVLATNLLLLARA